MIESVISTQGRTPNPALANPRPFLYRGGFQRFSGRGLNGRGASAPRGQNPVFPCLRLR